MKDDTKNPLSLDGIALVEVASRDPKALHALLLELGFSRVHRHHTRAVDAYVQNNIVFLLNQEPASHALSFESAHGPCVPAMGWRVTKPAAEVARVAAERGAEVTTGDYEALGAKVPAIRGIGGSLVYLIDPTMSLEALGFVRLDKPDLVPSRGFLEIDHLTNNVFKGTMERTASFYKDVFGFTEVRYFDIRGEKTGLTSYALRSPCGKFCIPINQGTDKKSQINEYLDEYGGPGVQHIALSTDDILGTLTAFEGSARVSFLDIDDEYYREVWDRVPNVTESHAEIAKRKVLVDGDDEGYLLQIFTKNVIGPIFFEIIQRKNHLSFGEGNFGALFRSIERDQIKRGYLEG